jgi:hypothetical protein
MIAALKVDEQRPSSDFCGEIIAPDTSIKGTGQKKAGDSQASLLLLLLFRLSLSHRLHIKWRKKIDWK